jgi:hypothetical protein
MERLRKALRLTRCDYCCLIQAWILLHLFHAGLRCRSLPTLVRWCRSFPSAPPRLPAQDRDPARVAWLVTLAARIGPLRTTCLTQGLALLWLLERHGLPASLQIGVARDQGQLGAHAWVVHGGRTLLGFAASEPESPLTSTMPIAHRRRRPARPRQGARSATVFQAIRHTLHSDTDHQDSPIP